jgi:small Trp-rich protein
MYLVWLGAILVLLKWFEVLFFKDLSWLWVMSPLALAFIYFEVLEPMFGWDKKRAYDEAEAYKQKRIQKQLKNQNKK